MSSAEAEIYAMREACRDARLMAWRAEETGVEVNWPLEINVDNKAGISFQQDTCMNSRIRGVVDMREDWVSELRDRKQIMAVKVDTAENVADIFTKSLSGTVIDRLGGVVKGIAQGLAAKAKG